MRRRRVYYNVISGIHYTNASNASRIREHTHYTYVLYNYFKMLLTNYNQFKTYDGSSVITATIDPRDIRPRL